MAARTLRDVVSVFGATAKAKLDNPAIGGAPEDQLRAPLEALITQLAALTGMAENAVALVGETALANLGTRPDYAVSVQNALAGFIEVKAPGKGSDPRKFSDKHDKEQWGKLKSLPNLIYTDGNSFSLWRDGELAAKIVHLDGDIETSGNKLAAPDTLVPLISDFLTWEPIPPKSASALAKVAARLCRLLRDEVLEQMEHGNKSLALLADDWRSLLFPEADDAHFADGYAQAVTFGLLIARAHDIELVGGVDLAAFQLKKTNSLIGTALGLLTENDSNKDALKTSLDTLARVLNAVNWHEVSKDKADAWLYFYEDFLDVYDRKLKKATGSYYTPPEVVDTMVRLVDEALRGPLFERSKGLASDDVTIADPAVGTGTFLLGVLRKIAGNVAADQGAGAVGPAMSAAAKRLFGFELQFGPYAVAQLRLMAEMQVLANGAKKKSIAAPPEVNLYITDTLGNPFVEDEQLPQIVEAVARSRREANKVKRGQPITVVIGNPPYKEKAEGRGGWIERGSGGKLVAPLDRWKAPVEWGVGAHGKHLKNLYIYFWRWAALKVFGSGLYAATGNTDKDEEGLIAYITVAGFLNGPGFEKMRDDLRRTCSAIWVIDCSPEGHQPEVATRIFPTVQQPICIVMVARAEAKASGTPARVLFHALGEGRKAAKFVELGTLSLHGEGWRECPADWREPFLPEHAGRWETFAPLSALFAWSGAGVKPHRIWPIAPDVWTLEQRWNALVGKSDPVRKEALFQPDADRNTQRVILATLGTYHTRQVRVQNDADAVVPPVRYSFRSFDRQWIVPDHRLLSRARPALWAKFSLTQVFVTAPEDRSIDVGPAITLTGSIVDQHHYHGRGGRVYPLWADAKAKQSNIAPKALELLAQTYGKPVSPEDVLAYIAAVMAHPGFTERFSKDLKRPGLRLPLTADLALFEEAVQTGREVVWLHCYGERFNDAKAGRPKGAPRLPKDRAPFIPAEGTIPGAGEALPDTMEHDAAKNRLHVGKGFVENVTKEMWEYEISGKQVLWQWFSYRRLDRSRPVIGDRRPPSPLEKIQPDHWLPEYTTDLLDLLNVLGRVIDLHRAQAAMLERICASTLIDVAVLREAGLAEAAAADVDAEPE